MNIKVFLILFFAMLSTAIGLNVVVPLLPIYVKDMGAGGIGFALIYSGFALARAVFLPFIDSLSKKFNRRSILIFGLFCNAIVAIFFIASSKVYQLVLARMFHGFSQSLVMPPIRAYVGEMAPPGKEGKIVGVMEMAFAGGLAIGPFIGGRISNTYGMATAFTVMGMFAFLAMWIVIFGIKKEVKMPSELKKNNKIDDRVSMLSLFKNFDMLALFLVRVVSFAPSSLLWTFQILYLGTYLNFDSAQTGMILSMNLIMQTIAQPIGGKLADTFNRMVICAVTGLLVVVLMVFLPNITDYLLLVILNAIIGFIAGVQQPSQLALAVSYGNKHSCMAASMNFMDLSFSLGMVIGPLTNGLLWSYLNPQNTYYATAIVGAIAYIAYLIAMKKNYLKN